MGSSLVKFGEMGLWVKDSRLQIWLHLLLQEIDAEVDLPVWAQKLREDWFYQANLEGMGIITVGLEKWATGPDRVSWLIHISEKALFHLESYGDAIPKEIENTFPHHGGSGSDWTNVNPTYEFIELGRKFFKLLRGELTIDPNDPRYIVRLNGGTQLG